MIDYKYFLFLKIIFELFYLEKLSHREGFTPLKRFP